MARPSLVVVIGLMISIFPAVSANAAATYCVEEETLLTSPTEVCSIGSVAVVDQSVVQAMNTLSAQGINPLTDSTIRDLLMVTHSDGGGVGGIAVAQAVGAALTEGPYTPGCNSRTDWRTGYNRYNQPLYRYYQQIEWCWDDKTIIALKRKRWGDVYMAPWEFVGHVGSSRASATDGHWKRRWTQGHFKLCWGSYCAQHTYPWVEHTVYANGLYAKNTGG